MAVQRRRASAAGQLLEEARLSGEATRQILLERNHGADVSNQIADMVSGAVQRALRQLSGGAPVSQRPLGAGGEYKFTGPVDDTPPAQVVVSPKRPPDMAEPPKLADMRIDSEQPRSGDGEVPWVF